MGGSSRGFLFTKFRYGSIFIFSEVYKEHPRLINQFVLQAFADSGSFTGVNLLLVIRWLTMTCVVTTLLLC